MTRKYVDCRDTPSVSGCTLAMSGEEEELAQAAARHAVDVHGHADDEQLRAMTREGLRDAPVADTAPGAFIQLIEFRTDRIDEVEALAREWAEEIGADRTARWGVTTSDRDRAGTYIEMVEFPSYEAAMANSANPATSKFAERLQKLCEGEPRFLNLDVHATMAF
ncbi:DUF1059 domain-containing protein [Prauserella alba]|uniref:DUF1059 domain-containing protein n=1 Tax=Prauserella alba TaxID=176898 RepID=A0ABN1V920_9PSEU|nr:DUF1059 domain-containing protein [Prauserella alba]MCP2181676.1 Protein of unknown function (DUF1059) [Prauserella alba]